MSLRRKQCTKTPLYYGIKKISHQGQVMHNLISFNQLASSKYEPTNDLIEEYYECLIECDDDQNICKRICREVFT